MMKILMLAWRDMKHPDKGGAEIVTDIYLSGLSKLGHKVTLFTARYNNSKEKEEFNGYTIIRKGKKLLAHYYGFKFAKNNQKDFDIIIDQVNTIPFFTPLAIRKEKRIAFFHQLCREIWFYEKPFPISIIGYLAESIYLKLYKNTKTFTVSNSSKQDLINHAYMNPNNILVLENQINFKPISKQKAKNQNIIKNKKLQFVFVGRLTKSKRVHHIIKALSILNQKDVKLYIIGEGKQNYKIYLKKSIKRLNLDKQIIFTGRLQDRERDKIVQSSIAIIVTSVKEGWGLIVTEANANGTIAITYNTDGLRDANNNSKNMGFITNKNTPEELMRLMEETINKPNEIEEKSKNALEFANEHANWDINIRRLEEWIKR